MIESNHLLNFINHLLASLVLMSHVLFVFGIVYYIYFKGDKKNKIISFFAERGILFAFIISLASTLGSLFYSEIVGFEPCKLCWFERIFMYPQTILLGIALLTKDIKVIRYSLPLLIIGSLYSLYHNYIYIMKTTSAFCGTTGVSCIKRYIFEYGYITIPVMSLTAFVLIISFLIVNYRYTKNS